MFIDCLPNCIVIIVFLGLERGRFISLARYTHRCFLQSPAYLAHTSTVSLAIMIPAGFLAMTIYSRLGIPKLPNGTVPFAPPLLQIAQDKTHERNEQNPRLPSSPLPPVERKTWGAGGWKEEVQSSGRVDQSGGYPSISSRSQQEPRLLCARLGPASQLVRSGPTVRKVGQPPVFFFRSQNPVRTCLILSINTDLPVPPSTETGLIYPFYRVLCPEFPIFSCNFSLFLCFSSIS